LILHCGLHKTATSYIQHALTMSRRNLAEAGVTYPTMTELGHDIDAPDHNALAERIMDRLANGREITNLLRPVSRLKGDTILLSAETFGTLFLTEPHLAEVLSRLSSFEVALIYYIRRQDDLKESVFAEVVKRGHSGAIEDETHYQYDHLKRFRVVERQVPPSHLIIRPYNAMIWPNGNLLEDFRRATDLPPVAMNLPGAVVNRANPRALTYLLSRAPNLAVKNRVRHFAKLCPELFTDRSTYLSPGSRRVFRDRYTAANAACAERHGLGDMNTFLGIHTESDDETWRPIQTTFERLGDRLQKRWDAPGGE
jgi:hypothetical protein